MRHYTIPIIAILIAIAITATMDFTGYTNFSALPLFGILIIFWLLEKHSKKEIGLKFGKAKYYGLAVLYPLFVLGLTALIAYLYGDISIREIDERKDLLNLAADLVAGPLVILLTEEGFFRGYLWASFKKAGITAKNTLFITSMAFIIWHISAVTSGSDYSLPISQIPIYLINGSLLGLIWGTLRWASGSIIVASVCHALWNGFTYLLFGYGEKIGLLGITDTFIFGPEIGYLGIILNGCFFLWLWKITKSDRLNS